MFRMQINNLAALSTVVISTHKNINAECRLNVIPDSADRIAGQPIIMDQPFSDERNLL